MKYLAALLALLFFFAPLTAAYALPKYANAEGVPCSYCHVAAVGGGARNYRGVFYRLNQHSFAGFDDAAEAKKKEVPLGPGADLKPLSLKAVPPPVLKPAAPELPPIAAVDLQTVADFGRWQDPVSRLWFVKIPAGSYRRGTTDAQTEALKKAGLWSPQNADEQPARTVEIGRSFLLGATEVTQADWKRIMAEVQGGKLASPSAFKGEDRPVDSVSFQDAQLFCRTLREAIGNKGFYRLPSEAEWEYAARAGSDGVFPLGTDHQPITPETLKNYAWMNGTAPNATGKAGGKLPNAWGLYDMMGNVWEWCLDAYSPTAYTTLPAKNPVFSSPNATERVLRGGCWFLDTKAQRPALRGGNLPTFKSQYVGLRIVREL